MGEKRREEKRRKLRVRAREIKNSRFESERTPFARKLANIPQSSQTATTTPDPPPHKKEALLARWRRCAVQVRIWYLPAFDVYFTPLNGLYFSQVMSSLFTLTLDGTYPGIRIDTLTVGCAEILPVPGVVEMDPLILCKPVGGSFLISHLTHLPTWSNEVMPIEGVNETLFTCFGIGISITNSSIVFPPMAPKPISTSNLPWPYKKRRPKEEETENRQTSAQFTQNEQGCRVRAGAASLPERSVHVHLARTFVKRNVWSHV